MAHYTITVSHKFLRNHALTPRPKLRISQSWRGTFGCRFFCLFGCSAAAATADPGGPACCGCMTVGLLFLEGLLSFRFEALIADQDDDDCAAAGDDNRFPPGMAGGGAAG